VVHIWFFKALPSRLGTLLDMKTADLEKVILFQDYVVTAPGQTPLKPKQILTEDEYRSAAEKYGGDFKAMMGAEAVRALLEKLDLPTEALDLREGLKKTNSKQKIKDLTKRLKLVENIRTSGNRAEWMVMDVIPVIPPDLRPLVLLESGNFATSDLNDLYRRIINRNNRLKKMMDLNAPEVIIRNEKRMLQQAVDALFDNARCRRPVQGTANRPLKSLTDMIKGKQGRFRENLLGKRVDYSARSVIVIGPELKLHQCGLPKKIALELFQPFIIRKLKERGLADTIKSAKRMLERRDREIWDVLEEVIYQHPVLLNRAPTLHRMGIQAFEPVLVEGNAIKIHPLVCKGFNADFDGDQMAVHLPLSIEAQAEAHVLMLATNNVFSPSSGAPIMSPSQDIVLGIYYLTSDHGSEYVKPQVRLVKYEDGQSYPVFSRPEQAMTAYELGLVGCHAKIVLRVPTDRLVIEADRRYKPANGRIITTPGRCVFNDILPKGLAYYNYPLGSKGEGRVISDCYQTLGKGATLELLDKIKELGFKHSTLAGLSFGITDAKIPPAKPEILDRAQTRVDQIEKDFHSDAITEGERYNQIVDVWVHTREELTKALLQSLESDLRPGAPIVETARTFLDKTPEEMKKDDESRRLILEYGFSNILTRVKWIPIADCQRLAGLPVTVGDLEDYLIEALAPQINSSARGGRRAPENFSRAVESICEKVRAKDGWVDCSSEETRQQFRSQGKGNPVSESEGVYFFCSQDAKIERGFLGYIGKSEKSGLRGRLEQHFNPQRADNFPKRFAEFLIRYEGIDKGDPNYLNPVWLMLDSGARGNIDQIRQLAGMRGLMSKPSGEIIETPIKANFREGLTVLEYFSSTHGARKGLADTALKTADSGYLTRKLADVAQNVIINELDCHTLQGITKSVTYKGEQIDVPLRDVIVGRVARENIVNPVTDETIVKENQIITYEMALKIEDLGLETIRVRSPMTCESLLGVCAKCYGRDMSTGRLVEEGMAVGIIGAQSIGEPGTQLTMRTFHTGGVATRAVVESEILASVAGTIKYHELNAVPEPSSGDDKKGGVKGYVALKRNGEIAILDEKNRELDKFKVAYGTHILVKDGQKVRAGQRLTYWDPHRIPILAEASGIVRFQDIEEGETVRVEVDARRTGGGPRLVVVEHKGEKHPRIVIEDKGGKILDFHYLPSKARIEVEEGESVESGQLLARQPREMSGTQDITGGLPRVTEIFEARRPKDPAAMAEISGRVELRTDKRRGKMTVVVRSESGMEREHHVPHDQHLLVHTGDYVEAGDRLTEGPLVPHNILAIRGEEALQQYLLAEIQAVYRGQGQNINDKHMEIILTQMLRKVRLESTGDTELLPGEVVDKFRFRGENQRLAQSMKIIDAGDTSFLKGDVVLREKLEQANMEAEALGGTPAKARRPKPATAKTLLLGITKASLQSESFLSAASFQESTKVFTEASLAGKIDELRGLKENVILGHLIPAGTSFKPYMEMKIKRKVELHELMAAEREEMTEAQITQAVQQALMGQQG
jgi:DNA-directed RNA polymerase beta' subunit